MRRILAVLLVLAAPLSARAQKAADVITDKSVHDLFDAALADVEKETGTKMDPAPTAKIASAKEVADILVDELVPQIPLLQPGLDEAGNKAAARQMADLLSGALLGKYAYRTNTFYIVRENFDTIAAAWKDPSLVSKETLRTIMIHELAHAADHAKFKAFDRIPKCKTADELHAYNAVLEGHAQFVTWRILSKEDDGDEQFDSFERIVGAVPPGTEQGLKQMLEVLNALSRFAYHDGLAFWKAMEKSGRKDFVEAVFKDPPATKSVILHPERYGKADEGAKAKDLAALWDAIKKDFGDDDWNFRVVPLGEVEIRASAGDFIPKDKVDAVVKALRGGELLACIPKAGPAGSMVAIGVCEFEKDDDADLFFALNSDLHKAKDAKFKSGSIQITEAKYGELAVEGSRKTLDARKTVQAMGQEIKVRDAEITIGRYSIEVLYNNRPAKKKDMEALAAKVVEFLKE